MVGRAQKRAQQRRFVLVCSPHVLGDGEMRLGKKQKDVLARFLDAVGDGDPYTVGMSDRYARAYFGMSVMWRLTEMKLLRLELAIMGPWFFLTEEGFNAARTVSRR